MIYFVSMMPIIYLIFYKGVNDMFVMLFFFTCTMIHTMYSSDTQQPQSITIQLYNSNTNQPQTQSNIKVNPHTEISPNMENKADACADAAAQSHALNHTVLSQYAHNGIEQIQTFIQEHNIGQYPERLQSCAYTYLYRIVAASCIALYVSFCTHLYRARNTITQKYIWSTWQSEKTLTDLLKQNVDTTTKQLLLAIQTAHTNPTNPTDFLTPIVTFYTEIQKEITLLEKYHWYYALYKKTYLTKCIPFDLDAFNTLQERIDRAYYIQTVFKQWMAHYNVQHQMNTSIVVV